MAFFGYTFIFDNVPSETFNLYVSAQNGGGLEESMGSSDINLLTQTVFRNPKPYLLGVQQEPVLSFDVQFLSPDEITSSQLRAIQAWLFGHQGYKQLNIVQYDMQDVHFNCFMTSPKVVRTANKINGVSATIVCDSPFGWGFLQNHTVNSVGTFSIYNPSDNNDYTYPTITLTMNSFGGIFSLTNNTDGARLFEITGLDADEVITFDNEKCIITSSTGLRRLANFNKNWFRLVRGGNSLTSSGNFAEFSKSYYPARKVA